MLSIIIPTRHEQFLEKTIQGLLENAGGDIEILVALDGYNPTERNPDPRVKYLELENIGMRQSINTAVKESKGEYLMKIDAHCIVPKDYDLQLIKDHQPNWVQIPRRYNLDPDKWCRGEKVVDYELFIFPLRYSPASLHGYKWPERAIARENVMIDDTLTFQGSCYFIARKYWDELDLLNDDGYGTLPAQEATYIGMTVWSRGGRVVVNKNTWYAHLFKGQRFSRGYYMSKDLQRECYAYSYNHWVNEHKEDFIKIIEKFLPMPKWATDWKERLWMH